MNRMEYRVEQIHLNSSDRRTRQEQIADQLNQLANEGWRVTSIDLAPRPSWGPRLLPVVLEREAGQPLADASGYVDGRPTPSTHAH